MYASCRKRAKLHFSGDRSWQCTSRAKRLQVGSELPGDWPITFSLLVECDRVNGNPGLLSTQSRWRTGPISQDTVLVLLQTVTCREATFTEKYLDQWRHLSMKKKKNKSKLRVWTRGTSTAFTSRSRLRWSDWVWCRAQQRVGSWNPDNLVGNKPLRPRWQSHFSGPNNVQTEWPLAWRGFLVIATTYTRSPVLRGPKLTLPDGAWRREPLGSSDIWHLLARLELSGWSVVKVCALLS